MDLCRRKCVENIVTAVIPRTETNLAEDKNAAELMRKDTIIPALRSNKPLQLDFGGVQITTQSFIHALLAEPLRLFGPDHFTGRIFFARASTQVKQVLKIVVQHVAAESDGGREVTDFSRSDEKT